MEAVNFDLKMFSRSESVVCTKSRAYDALFPHSHNFWELAMVVSGNGIHRLGVKKYNLTRQDGYFIVDGSSHSVTPIEGKDSLEIINIIFNRSFIEEISTKFLHNECFHFDTYLEQLFLRAYWEYENKRQGYTEIIRLIVLQILQYVMRDQMQFSEVERKNVSRILRREEIVNLVVQYIEQHYREDIRVEEIAQSLGVGVSTMQKIFKDEKQTTVKKTINKKKMSEACRLLIDTDYSVQSISEIVGINDLKNFYRIFRATTGQTPNEYRTTNCRMERSDDK